MSGGHNTLQWWHATLPKPNNNTYYTHYRSPCIYICKRFKRIIMCKGFSWESMTTSPTISISDDNAVCEGQVNSPARREQKKPRQKAAQSINLSWANGLLDQTACILRRSSGVIGRRLARGLSTPLHRRPFSTYSSCGNDDSDGSGRLFMM